LATTLADGVLALELAWCHEHGHHEHGHGAGASTVEEDCKEEDCKDDSHDHAEHGHADDERAPTEEAFDAHGHAESYKEEPGTFAERGDTHGHGHEHGHAQEETGGGDARKKKRHDLSGVGSIAFISEERLVSARFNRFMSDLLAKKSRDIYRSKGVLCFENEGNKKFVFQGVHEDITFTEANTEWEEDGPKVSKVVFIGRDLDREELEKGFNACKSSPNQRAATESVFPRPLSFFQ